MAVQLGVGHRAPCRSAGETRCIERLASPAPRRPVTAGVPRRAARRPPVATLRSRLGRSGERRLQLAPRPRRVVEPHCASIERMSAERKFAFLSRVATSRTHSTRRTVRRSAAARASQSVAPRRCSWIARRRQQLGRPLPVTERRGQQPEAAIHRAEVPRSRQRHPRAAVAARASARATRPAAVSLAAKATAVAPTATCGPTSSRPGRAVAARSPGGWRCRRGRRAGRPPRTPARTQRAATVTHPRPMPALRSDPAAAAHSPLRNNSSSCCASSVLACHLDTELPPGPSASSIAAIASSTARVASWIAASSASGHHWKSGRGMRVAMRGDGVADGGDVGDGPVHPRLA